MLIFKAGGQGDTFRQHRSGDDLPEDEQGIPIAKAIAL
jgi:hypothetical protein